MVLARQLKPLAPDGPPHLIYERYEYLGPDRPHGCAVYVRSEGHRYIGAIYPPLPGRYGRDFWWVNPTLEKNLRRLGCELERDFFPSLGNAQNTIRDELEKRWGKQVKRGAEPPTGGVSR